MQVKFGSKEGLTIFLLLFTNPAGLEKYKRNRGSSARAKGQVPYSGDKIQPRR